MRFGLTIDYEMGGKLGTNLKAGERACPRCKETIKADATICKHCKTEFSAAEIEAAKAEQRKATKYGAIGCLGLVFLLGLCTYAVSDKTPSPAKSGNQAASDKPGPTAKADAITFYRSVMAAISPCDAAGQTVATAGKAGDLVGIYRAASAMESACLSVPGDIRAIDVPESVGAEARTKLTQTREVCENAYVQRWSAAGKMKEVLDENGAIGRQAELKDTMELVQAGTLACATGLVGQVMSLGATQADLAGKGK
jgi:hypothetical protein